MRYNTPMSQKLALDLNQRPTPTEVEERVLQYWNDIDAFRRSIIERSADNPYVFYDGPPFVTGTPHYGSILGSIAKDVVPRYWTMKGYRVERQWGWDCHGLPIENMIEKDLGIKNGKKGIEAFGIANFNNACRTAIAEFDAAWEVIIGRIGRWVDFANQYKTMDTEYMESVWWAFKNLYEKELVYEGRKVILYCPRCATPLSNFEIAMDNSYIDVTEPSNTYKYAVKDQANTYLLAWSTTPWNKIATPALAVNPDLMYVKVKQGEEFYILAESRLDALTDVAYEVEEQFPGAQLADLEFELHYDFFPEREGKRAGVVVADEFVTADTGTGIVTLAVYGEDDLRVMQAHDIQQVEHVDDEGKLKPEVTPWAGMDILAVNPLVNADLAERGLMYREEPHTHSVATCYRCGTRLYYAPLPAWFVDIQKLKPQLLEQNEKVNWYPGHLKHGRFANGVKSAPDWNISRSRYWGTPMPVWESKDGQRRIIGSRDELREWAVNPEQVGELNDIHREFIDDIEVWIDDARTIKGKRIPEVFDCWVESGSMPFAAKHYPFANKEQFEKSYPAQFVSEYIAQTRAWFYTMHVMSVGLFGTPAVENTHTSGVVLAADGNKMSKSKKNYTDPMILIDRDGADALRLYLMSSPVMNAENLAFTDSDVTILRKRVLNIWWNVFAFYDMYKPADWTPSTPEPTNVMDQWILALLENTREVMTNAMDHYDVATAAREIISFVDQLSTWYLRQSRDRLRGEGEQQTWNTFHHVLLTFAKLAAPVVPFITEAMYQGLSDAQDSVHLDLWPEADPQFANPELLTEMAAVRRVVEQGHALRKNSGLKLRQPLAKMTVVSAQAQPRTSILDVVAQELNVKMIGWTQQDNVELQVHLDTNLTPELIEEGEAREIVRAVQTLRKESGVAIDGRIILTLTSWPAYWTQFIQDKTKAEEIRQGETMAIESV